MQINQLIAQELGAQIQQVDATILLLDGGATVPFIARYRKEATGGLDDTQLRLLDQRLTYLRELEDRRLSILKSIDSQGLLNQKLKDALLQASTKTRLEDLYLPFKPKRRTKGQIAKEAGLLPLAKALLQNPELIPTKKAAEFLNPNAQIQSIDDALEGAKYILMDEFAEDAELLGKLRHLIQTKAHLNSSVVKSKKQAAAKYRDYFEHNELLSKVPSHRALAMLRAKNEGFLRLSLDLSPHTELKPTTSPAEQLIAEHLNIQHKQRNGDDWLKSVLTACWKLKLSPQLETELLAKMREKAEQASITIFATNLKDLLMAAPAGSFTTIGLDPGMRTGVKLAVVDDTGKVLYTATIFPHAPQNAWDKSLRTLEQISRQFKVSLLSIGNGTGSRETDKLAAELIKKAPELNMKKIMVSEAGASVYSASELAANEFPDMDVSLRGAVSIARRLQDPLAELVKIEPKAIGVGQYQHDVNQSQLALRLSTVVEDCVNAVGVDLNRASAALLAYVSGLSKTIAQNVVRFREENGRFNNRKDLLNVPRLGPKAFEQCAGFLRITDGSNPLDASAVHPETYTLAQTILDKCNVPFTEIVGNTQILNNIEANNYVTEKFGLPTIKDLLSELIKPGRDPRPEFKTAIFKEGIESVKDLEPGMTLEGVVSNVANFGAFVDIGVHQDGLVHISALSNSFVDDPHKIVKAGDIVKVKVIEVDAARKRINLSMRLDDTPQAKIPEVKTKPSKQQNVKQSLGRTNTKSKPAPMTNSAFADAFAKAKKK